MSDGLVATLCAQGGMFDTFCQGDTASVFLLASIMMIVSVWMLFLKPRIPIPQALPRGLTRFLLEICNDWLRIFGGVAGAFFLPIGTMLVLATLTGGLAFWHWPVALVMFAGLIVWHLR